MVEQADYGRGFKDGIKDTSRRIEEAKEMARNMEKERILNLLDDWNSSSKNIHNTNHVSQEILDKLKFAISDDALSEHQENHSQQTKPLNNRDNLSDEKSIATDNRYSKDKTADIIQLEDSEVKDAN